MTDMITSFVPRDLVIPPSRLRLIAEEVAHKHGLTLSELKAQTRAHKISHARHEAMARMKEETTASNMKIAKFFGFFDHSITIYAHKMHKRRSACS